ncbi:neuronal Synaptobrevin isoform X2 [Ptiloglossa arizonensis]|uniref:neuronal Synaptobrevin isoform X2 n=1 Tax=Ptiloglossa arizonensis TaxID=3350558 RepID=UPI003F9F78DC
MFERNENYRKFRVRGHGYLITGPKPEVSGLTVSFFLKHLVRYKPRNLRRANTAQRIVLSFVPLIFRYTLSSSVRCDSCNKRVGFHAKKKPICRKWVINFSSRRKTLIRIFDERSIETEAYRRCTLRVESKWRPTRVTERRLDSRAIVFRVFLSEDE